MRPLSASRAIRRGTKDTNVSVPTITNALMMPMASSSVMPSARNRPGNVWESLFRYAARAGPAKTPTADLPLAICLTVSVGRPGVRAKRWKTLN